MRAAVLGLVVSSCFAAIGHANSTAEGLTRSEDSSRNRRALQQAGSSTDIPEPVAFFPLQNTSLASVRGSQSRGVAAQVFNGTQFADDSELGGTVLECSQSDENYVLLSNVTYGVTGAFAINMWLKPTSLQGPGFSYIYSHNASSSSKSPDAQPNQVQIYIPQLDMQAYGVIRTLVRDRNDKASQPGNATGTFLDTDNSVSQSIPTNDTTADIVQDGRWHMFTLTSFRSGVKGYAIYLDGQKVAEMTGNFVKDADDGALLPVTGGDPLDIKAPITLCARSDLSGPRYYDGRIANLGIWDDPLTAPQIAALFDQEKPLGPATITPPADAAGLRLPRPTAFFPLLENITSSKGAAVKQFNGSSNGRGATFVPDYDLGGLTVLQCNATYNGALSLQSVPYGLDGRFTVSIWAKFGNNFGEGQAYFYSHWNTTDAAASNFDNATLSTNQVEMYVPETGNPSFGVIRTVVKDSNDDWQGSTTNASPSLSFIDSDGKVGWGAGRILSENSSNVIDDDQWHMVTVSTHSEGGRGFELYVDGNMVGQTLDSREYIGSDNSSKTIDGGDPIYLNSPITLCGRADRTSTRAFNGRLASLVIFDEALSPAQVALLYSTGIAGMTNISTSGGVLSDRTVSGLPLCNEKPRSGKQRVGCQEPTSVCFPLPEIYLKAYELESFKDEGAVGVCAAAFPNSKTGMLPLASDVPWPTAFFPLNRNSFQSWPLQDWTAVAKSATIESDPLFGSALTCDRDLQSQVFLPSGLGYADDNGKQPEFSVNFWQRAAAPPSKDGPMYMFSHETPAAASDEAKNGSSWGPSQIKIYLPTDGGPEQGLVRAVVKSASDTDRGDSSVHFLDSDGLLDQDSMTLKAGTASNPTGSSLSRKPPVNVQDGKWHMVTLTSQADGSPGSRLFVDGNMVAETSGPSADGSGFMGVNGSAVLCGRSDNSTDRNFSGKMAYLGLYDVRLTQRQVASLFRAVKAEPDRAPPPEQACQLPLLFNGRRVGGCLDYDDKPACWSRAGSWISCGPEAGVSEAKNATLSGVQLKASRTRSTKDGRGCMVPAVYQGTVYNGCVPSSSGDDVCLTNTGWGVCSSNTLSNGGGVGGSGLSGGAIAGIVIGVVAGLILLAAAVIAMLKCRKPDHSVLPIGTMAAAANGNGKHADLDKFRDDPEGPKTPIRAFGGPNSSSTMV